MAEDEHIGSDTDENVQKKLRGSVLDHFKFISNDHEPKRLKNAKLLLKHLLKVNDIEKDNSEVKYALNRLIRGLGSSRNCSRVGFYSTLVALLSSSSTLDVEQVLNCVNKQLQTGRTNSKSEGGDIYTGQILSCGAVIRSNMFSKGSAEEQKRILEMLFRAGKKRSYLGLAAASFIAELLPMVDAKQFETSMWPVLKPEILQPWPNQTLDSLYLLILVKNKFPELLKPGTLKKSIGTRVLLCEENMKPICDILLDILGASSLKHSAYALLSKEIAASEVTSSFVTQLDLQLTKVNRNKLLAVSIILRNMLPNLQNPSQIPELLTTNFVQQMLQYFRNHHNNNHDQEFQETMTKLFDCLSNCLQGDNIEVKTKVAVLKTILFYPGSFMIENITKSKIVQQLVRTLDVEGVKKLSKLYKDVVVAKKGKVIDENVTEMWLNAERIYAAQLLTKLLGHPRVSNELEWKVENLKLLINVGIVHHQKYLNIGVELANGFRDVFFRALDQKFPKLENMCNVLSELTNHVESLVTADNYEEILRVPLTEEDLDLLRQVYTITKKLEAKKEKNKYALVFQILFFHMGLQLFKDKELAVASLNELFQCYERAKHDKKQKNLGDPEWIDVIVDLFLNLLSYNSHLLRNVIGCVFPHLCKYMTPSSIHQILSVLDPKNETNPLSHADDESDSGDDEEEESEESDGEDEGDDGENESENDEESEFEENETVNDKLRMAVRNALGNDGYLTDEESINLDDMSDTEGQRLDDALAQAFKQFKPNRGKNNKKQTKDAQTLTHFRVRVLDLVEIYLDSEPSMLSCLEIMLPLLQALEFTIKDEHQKPLQMRVRHCLKKLKHLKKFGSTDGVTDLILGDLLSSLLEKGTKSAMIIQDMSTEISDCCIFIVKCSQALQSAEGLPKKTKKKLKDKLIDVLKNAINMYFNQRDCLIPYYLFKSMFQLQWGGNLQLVPLVFQFAFSDETRPFRRSQALELLKIFYLNRRTQGLEEAFRTYIGEHDKTFCDKVVQMLDEFCKDPKSKKIKERFIYHVFNLLKAMASHPVKNADIDWKLIGEKVREYRSCVTLSRDAKVAYNQLCVQLHIPNAVQMKNQTVKLVAEQDSESDDENGSGQGKIKPRKRNQGALESKKLKKEARALRFQSMSEGLSSHFSFSSVNMRDISKDNNNDESNSESDSKGSRKRKQKDSIGANTEDSSDETAHANGSTTKDKSKRLSNGIIKRDVEGGQPTSEHGSKKNSKRRSISEYETQNHSISPHKKKKHN